MATELRPYRRGVSAMKLPTVSQKAEHTPRLGFTLIELLVVIFIIGVLMALTAGAILRAMGAQQNNNAKTTIKKIDAGRQERYNAAVDVAVRNSSNIAAQFDPVNGPQIQATINTMAGTDPQHAKRAKAIYVSYYIKQQFPQSFAEVLNCWNGINYPQYPALPAVGDPRWYNPLGPNPAFVTKLKTLGIQANDPPLPGESTALLYMALEKGNNGQGKIADLFGANCVKPEQFPTTGGGSAELQIFKDEWTIPYQFYRWSTSNSDLETTLPVTSKSRNALDPDNTLMNINWYNYTLPPKTLPMGFVSPRALFEQTCYSVTGGNNQPYNYYITPVIVCAGSNKRLGLDLQTMADDGTGSSNDNITSYQIKRE
jgi:prepilin-type N-terminal cleavage/methylation domain-containing protein